MARSLPSPAIGILFSAAFLVAVVAGFLYLQTSYLQPDSQTVSTTRYPISKVVSDMAEGGPYDKAQKLLPAGSSASPAPVPSTPTVASGDLGKTDLSKFNQ